MCPVTDSWGETLSTRDLAAPNEPARGVLTAERHVPDGSGEPYAVAEKAVATYGTSAASAVAAMRWRSPGSGR